MNKISVFFAVFLLLLTVFQPLHVCAYDFDLDGYTLDCQAAYVINVDTGRVIFEKNADQHRSIASLTKIMTAVVVLEQCDELQQDVTVKQPLLSEVANRDLALLGLHAGEQICVIDLLYALLVQSAADAAIVLADFVGGTVDSFIEMMNKKAADLGLKDTHFADPYGLRSLSEDNYSTAHEIASLCEYAMKNELFAKIVSTAEYVIPATNLSDTRTIESSNRLLLEDDLCWYEKAIGIKPGYTSAAGRCLAAAATNGRESYISVVMGCRIYTSNGDIAIDRFIDSVYLLENAFNSFSLKTVLSKTQVVTTLHEQIDGIDFDVSLVPKEDFIWLVAKDEEIHLDKNLLQESISGPVKKGEKLGECIISVGDNEIGRVDLVAAEVVSSNLVTKAAVA